MKSAILITITLIVATQLVFAQTMQHSRSSKQSKSSPESDDDTITIDAALVNTHVSVRDKSGHSVSGLTKDDCTVLDEDKEQPIVFLVQCSCQAGIVHALWHSIRAYT